MVGKVIAPVTVSTATSDAWRTTSPRGSITLVDGTSSRPSAEVVLDGVAGHKLRLGQEGGDVLVYDEQAGVLSRIDSGHLSVDASRATVAGIRLVSGPTAAYLVDYKQGTAQRVDLKTLNQVGSTVRLPGTICHAGVDRERAGRCQQRPLHRQVEAVAVPVLAHRMLVTVDAQLAGATDVAVIERVLATTAVPAEAPAALPGAAPGAPAAMPAVASAGRAG